jgi:hypothetical protein
LPPQVAARVILRFEELPDVQLFLQKKDDLIKPKVMRACAQVEIEIYEFRPAQRVQPRGMNRAL